MYDFLDYGAYGLLAFVLFMIGREMRVYLASATERSVNREQRAREDRLKSEERMTELTSRSIEASESTADVLQGLCSEMRRLGKDRVVCDDDE